ncbi:MAG TPA: hypothetical protein VMY59_08860 [Candidatus Thermoplasmatota archaeon]|nr:hypothetical protein [Candidatus Thermoplasmatota archaeon]
MSKKKKDNIYSMMMTETLGYGTAGLVAGNLGALSGDPTSMNVFRIGSSLAGVPSLMGASKKVLDAFKGW